MQDNKKLSDTFSKCANYSVISILVSNTIKSMSRFKGLLPDEVITKVYSTVKAKATGTSK